MKPASAILFAAMLVALSAGRSSAASLDTHGTSGWTPRVPISGLARPMPGLDLTRLHVMSSFSFGTGYGTASQGLQVTSFSYQFAAPVAMRVSVANTFDSGGMSKMFLEGLDLSYRAGANTSFSVHFQNVRSPLQYQNQDAFGVFGPRLP